MALPKIVKDIEARVRDTGDTMTGRLFAHGGISLNSSTPENTAPQYLLGISAFANGGTVQWSSISNVASALMGNLDSRYVNISGDTMTGLLTTTSESSHSGLKIGNNYLTAIGNELILQNNNGIRFGGDAWNWDVWAGLKYNPSNKYIYLGLAGHSIFTANSTQSGGRILTPGISYFHVGNQTSYYFADTGNIYGHEIYSDSWFRSYNTNGWYNETYGCHLMPHDGSYGSIRIHGNARNGYEGLHFGTGNSGMTVMSINGSHQGLYQESTGTWIIYNYNGAIGLGGSGTTSGYRVTTNGSHYITGSTYSAGRYLSADIPSSWLNGLKNQASYRINACNDTGSYHPWIQQTNTASGYCFSLGMLGTSFYLIGCPTSQTSNGYTAGMVFNVANGYLQGCSRVYNAVWNDYAEFRKADTVEPGRVVVEGPYGEMLKSTLRLQAGGSIISDTYGTAMGETDECKTPIAVAGRVLAYPYESINDYKIGDAVCTGPDGTVSKMTREEIIQWPDRIVGIVSEIPTYDIWGQENIKVDGRIWIRIK